MNKEIAPVLEEISAVLKKHDMTGVVIVSNRTHCDFRMEIAASWSCAWFEEHTAGTALRVRAKREQFASAADQKVCMEQTVGMFVTFQHVMTRLHDELDKVLVMVSRSVDFLGKSTDETT